MLTPSLVLCALIQSGRNDPVVRPLVVPTVDGGGAAAPPSTSTVATGARAPGSLRPAVDAAPPVRIADMVDIDGVRDNQLLGSGIVVGLAGTGDRGTATRAAVANFIRRTDLNISADQVDSGNVALVSVTARLGKFPAPGTAIDVQVQSLGDASSLFGGTLLQTPLRGADGEVYVVAQGAVALGGFTAAGQAARLTRNHALVGVVASGGLVERGVEMHMVRGGIMQLHLRNPNYETAHRVAQRLNGLFPGAARALNHRTIRLRVPESHREDPVGFFAEFGAMSVQPGEEAVVVINERTGTLVAGHRVRISTAAITHGNLTITVAESPIASQPQPFAEGDTVVLPRSDVGAEIENRGFSVVQGGTSATELAEALNRLGVTPRDMVSIFLALQRAGHLHARVELM